MYVKKAEYPEKNEIVLCTVKKITSNSIFVTLNEYNNLEGLIHISEIAPGRIRNIRDYVKENKKIVCMVLTSDPSRHLVDLSLRRVSLQQRMGKEAAQKQKQIAERIFESIAKDLKVKGEDLYKQVGGLLVEKYGSLFGAFQNMSANGEKSLEGLKIDKKIAKKLVDTAQERIKKPQVSIESTLSIKNPSSDGVETIKEILKKAINHSKKNEYDIRLSYMGAPKFKMKINSSDFKSAEKILAEITELIEKESKKTSTIAEFERKK